MELLLAEEGRTDNAIGALVPIWVVVVTHMENNWASV